MFPAGMVSGAPEVRAMQIISELEGATRGPYAGCVGYFSFNGNLDTGYVHHHPHRAAQGRQSLRASRRRPGSTTPNRKRNFGKP